MEEKSLAQMIRERMDSERDACIDAETKRQWEEVMVAINEKASLGSHIAQYPNVLLYGYQHDAKRIVEDKLRENGFTIEYDRGTWIHW